MRNLQRSRKPPSWWGCPLPKNPTPTLGPSGLASSTRPHSKISSDAHANHDRGSHSLSCSLVTCLLVLLPPRGGSIGGTPPTQSIFFSSLKRNICASRLKLQGEMLRTRQKQYRMICYRLQVIL